MQTQKAKRRGWNIFPGASSYQRHSGAGLAAAMPIILFFAVIAAIPLYLIWVVRHVYKYPSSRRTFFLQEFLRLSWISTITLVSYAVADALFFKSHVYVSLFAMPVGVWLSWYANKKLRAATMAQNFENRKWESRRRRKIAKQHARELEKAA